MKLAELKDKQRKWVGILDKELTSLTAGISLSDLCRLLQKKHKTCFDYSCAFNYIHRHKDRAKFNITKLGRIVYLKNTPWPKKITLDYLCKNIYDKAAIGATLAVDLYMNAFPDEVFTWDELRQRIKKEYGIHIGNVCSQSRLKHIVTQNPTVAYYGTSAALDKWVAILKEQGRPVRQ